MKIEMTPIGYIKSKYEDKDSPPMQYIYNLDERAVLEIEEEFRDGMLGLEKGDYIVITFYMHKIDGYTLQHHPRRDPTRELRGIFATRGPRRPNKIGHSVCQIVDLDEKSILISGIDMLDGTPVLDIKAYDEDLYPREEKDES